MNETIQEKAIRLVKGDIVEIQGHFVELRHEKYLFDPCFFCDLNSKCHQRGEFAGVCNQCDYITDEYCYFKKI